MEKEQDQNVHLYGDPAKVIQYMDYSDEKGKLDNAHYIPELVPGVLQPLEINEIIEDDQTDQLLANIDIEKIVQEAEAMTKDTDQQVQKQMQYFPDPLTKDSISDMSKRKFSALMKKRQCGQAEFLSNGSVFTTTRSNIRAPILMIWLIGIC